MEYPYRLNLKNVAYKYISIYLLEYEDCSAFCTTCLFVCFCLQREINKQRQYIKLVADALAVSLKAAQENSSGFFPNYVAV